MREAINSTMYASGGGAYYDRTGDFLQAIAIEDQKVAEQLLRSK